ncbi:MAG: [ribosomal protein S5]-alanine N-acetyltransferase [Solirubrobacteraceae bacterium]|nr:[ribosomal protein S5]-alanine N-acetyltransferase [Solirubrobacteraceae bacterium]
MTPLPFPDLPMAAEGVALRPWRRDDAPQRFAAFNDPLCLRFSWPLTEPFTQEHVAQAFDRDEAQRTSGTGLSLALADAVDPDHVLGGVGLYDMDTQPATGYWLAAHARGRGVATAALRLLSDWALNDLVDRLTLTCAPDNVASQRVAERAGFTRERVIRNHIQFQGRPRDSVLFRRSR